MEKRYKDLSEEHEKTRKKLKQIKQKRINQGEPEEKFCKNC